MILFAVEKDASGVGSNPDAPEVLIKFADCVSGVTLSSKQEDLQK